MRLATAHLDLAPLIPEDATDMFLVMQDPALGRWTGDVPPTDADELRTRYAEWASRRSPSGDELWLNWVVRRQDDDRAVGHVAATVSEAETAIAWIVGTAYQRQGIATEAARALIAWLLEEPGAISIVASIPAGHEASEGVARSVAMRPTDRRDHGEVVWELDTRTYVRYHTAAISSPVTGTEVPGAPVEPT